MLSAAVTIAVKDLRRAMRSLFLVGVTVGAPVGIAAVIAFSFPSDTEEFRPVVAAIVSQSENAAATLELLDHESVRSLIETHRVSTEAEARKQILAGESEVAIVIQYGSAPTTRLLHDPAATVRPRIVEALLDRGIDVDTGMRIIAAAVAPEHRAAATAKFGAALAREPSASVSVTSPTPETDGDGGMLARIKARVILAQLIFFAFFAAGYGAQSILREEEEGTLARLRTMAVSTSTLLLGKALFLTLLVFLQAAVLLLISRLLFDIDLGPWLSLAIAVVGLVLAAVGLGLFLTSLVRTSRQAGPLLGGVLTTLGMAGGLFTVGFSELPKGFAVVALFVPHGWAMRGFDLAMNRASLSASLLSALACAGFGLVFAAIGLYRFRSRFSGKMKAHS